MSETVSTPIVKGNPNLRVILIDTEAKKIPEVLGISPERELELDEIVKKSYQDHDTITDTMEAASRNLLHANEFSYVMFHLGAHVGRAKAMQDNLGGLLGALSGLSNPSGE